MKTSGRVWLAIVATVVADLVLFWPLTTSALAFLRDRMRLYCSGGEGITCADGIGYIFPGLGLWFWMSTLFLSTALAIALFGSRPMLATRVLSGVAVAGLAFTVIASLVANAQRHPLDYIPADTWLNLMGVPTLLFGAAVVPLTVAIFSRSRVVIVGSLCAALALVFAATIVEPSLAFGTTPVVAALVAALLCATAPIVPVPVPDVSASER